MIWSHVTGQKKLKKQLKHLLDSKQVPHAQLFTGDSGYGGLPLALSFALQMLQIDSSQKINKPLGEKIQHPDLHFVYPVVKKGSEKIVLANDYGLDWAAFLNDNPYGNYANWFESINVGNKQGLIGVNEMNALHKKIYLKSYSGGNKVCVLWGVEKMNKEASNAFLKLLEEPPEKTFFILVAESSDQLLTTLVSRCQLVTLSPINENELLDTLEEDVPNRQSLVKQAEGDYRKLKLLIENLQNKAVEALLIKVLRTSLRVRGDNGAVVELMAWAGEISVLGREEQKTFLQYSIRFIRDAFLLNYSLGDLVHYRSENGFDINKLGPFVNSENINQLITLFEKSHYHITRNANAKMIFTELSLQLTRLLKKASE